MAQIVPLFDLDGLRREIEELERHRAGSSAVARAVEQLAAALEELQTAGEELEVKNEELARALVELEREHVRFRRLFDLLPDGFLLTDAAGIVTEVNGRATDVLERAARDLVGQPLTALFPVDAADAIHKLARRSGWTLVTHANRLLEVRTEPMPDTVEPGTRAWLVRDVGSDAVEGEDLTTDDAEVARSWLGVYSELLAITEQSLEALEAVRSGPPGIGRGLRADRDALEARLARLKHRQALWRDRHAELAGLSLDRVTGRLRVGLRDVILTRREAQLLSFLLKHPGTVFTTEALLNRAWLASFLSPEQLRTYIGRLRGKLLGVGARCRLENVRGQGYRLVFD